MGADRTIMIQVNAGEENAPSGEVSGLGHPDVTGKTYQTEKELGYDR